MGLICLSLPSLRLLLGHLLPNVLGTSVGGPTDASRYGKNYGKDIVSNRSRNQFQNLESQNYSASLGKQDIVMSRTYDVEYTNRDGDEHLDAVDLRPMSPAQKGNYPQERSQMSW